jgi:hypothetical protein
VGSTAHGADTAETPPPASIKKVYVPVYISVAQRRAFFIWLLSHIHKLGHFSSYAACGGYGWLARHIKLKFVLEILIEYETVRLPNFYQSEISYW